MSWDAKDVALLKKLWAAGQSAAQIARRFGCSRDAVCAKLTRLALKRGHKPPTAKPRIRPVPKRRPALLAACARPVAKKVSRKTSGRQPKEFTNRQLYPMLPDEVRMDFLTEPPPAPVSRGYGGSCSCRKWLRRPGATGIARCETRSLNHTAF